jgi:hypothetical protein
LVVAEEAVELPRVEGEVVECSHLAGDLGVEGREEMQGGLNPF